MKKKLINAIFYSLLIFPLNSFAQGFADLNSFSSYFYNLVPNGCYGAVSNNYAGANNFNLVLAGSWYDINANGLPGPSHTFINTFDFVHGVTNAVTINYTTAKVAGIEKIEISDNGHVVAYMPLTPPNIGAIVNSPFQISTNSGASFTSFQLNPNLGGTVAMTIQNGGISNLRRLRDFVITPNNEIWTFWMVWDPTNGTPILAVRSLSTSGVGVTPTLQTALNFGPLPGGAFYSIGTFTTTSPELYGEHFDRPGVEATVVTNDNKVVVVFSPSSSTWGNGAFAPAQYQIDETIHHYLVFDLNTQTVAYGRIGRFSGTQVGATLNQNLRASRITSDGTNIYLAYYSGLTPSGDMDWEIFKFAPSTSNASTYFPANTTSMIVNGFAVDTTDLDLLTGVHTTSLNMQRFYKMTAPKFPTGASFSNEVVLSYLDSSDIASGAPYSNGVIRNAIIDFDTNSVTSLVRNDITQNMLPAGYQLFAPAKPDASNLFGIKIGNNGYTMSSFCLHGYAGTAGTNTPPYGASAHFVDALPSQ